MSLMESIAVAFESLAANKMRTLLTMLGVIIGVSAVITMLALAKGASEKMMSNIQQMGTNVLIIRSGQSRTGAVMGGFGSSQTLTLKDVDAISKSCESIEKTAPEVSSNAQVKYKNQNTSTSILGTTPDYLGIRNYKVQDGRFFSDSDVKSSRKVAVLGPTVVTNLFGEVTPIGKMVTIKGIPFQVIGITAVKGTAGSFGDPDDQIFIPVTTAMRRVFGLQYVRSISAQATKMELMNQAVIEIGDVLRKSHRLAPDAEDDFDIRNQADIMAMADQAASIFTMLLGGIASVSLLVGGIGIMNIMLVSVTERTREIGIRMALGARRRDIQFQFLVESLVLSLLGGTVGTLLGMLAAFIISKISGWSTTVSPASVTLAFGFSAFVGIFFGSFPARKASKLDPIEALRWE
jgi:ABC-type antimicrobial peptide transport system permease subunit